MSEELGDLRALTSQVTNEGIIKTQPNKTLCNNLEFLYLLSALKTLLSFYARYKKEKKNTIRVKKESANGSLQAFLTGAVFH